MGTDRKDEGPLDALIRSLAGLPGLGPRSARRIALHLLASKTEVMAPFMAALAQAAESVHTCRSCGNLDFSDICRICRDERRSRQTLCVVAGVADLWALERTGAYKGRYHVLGGVLSALDGVGPDDLRIASLLQKVKDEGIQELILALSATVDGQATAHYLMDRLPAGALKVTRLAHGIPVGGELDHLDDGTIVTALKSRAAL